MSAGVVLVVNVWPSKLAQSSRGGGGCDGDLRGGEEGDLLGGCHGGGFFGRITCVWCRLVDHRCSEGAQGFLHIRWPS